MAIDSSKRRPAAAIVGASVEVRGECSGRVTDVILDPALRRVLGYELELTGGSTAFVPSAVARVTARGTLVLTTPGGLLDGGELHYYRTVGIRASELRGAPVQNGRATVGTLHEVGLEAHHCLSLTFERADGSRWTIRREALSIGSGGSGGVSVRTTPETAAASRVWNPDGAGIPIRALGRD